MSKIAYVTHGLADGGISTFLINVFEKIDRIKHDITVIIAIDEDVETFHEQKIIDLEIKVIHAGDLNSIGKKRTFLNNLYKIFKKEKFDIVHANMDLFNGLILYEAKRAKISKRISHSHTSKSQYNERTNASPIKILFQKTYKKIMQNLIFMSSTDLLSCSTPAGEYLYNKKPYKLIYNGVDFNKFSLKDKLDISEYKKQLQCNSNDKIIVSVGRLSPTKNPVFAVKIIKELSKIRDDFNYIWVGDGEIKDSVIKEIENSDLQDKVILLGARKDIPQIMNCCDMFFLPSLFEGLGIVYLEAQFSGLKSVASTEVPHLADIGRLKYFPLKKSKKEWAQFLSDELDRSTPSLDWERAKKFDINYTVKQLEEIYNN